MNKHTSAYQTEVREKGNETALLWKPQEKELNWASHAYT
jgi:hypothetical protein